ncbi:hypothetical protein ABZZ79_01320 [Streptomyces sp. NPDC006458]|uniref:hypothetical protein n=1 Tax=Streptomyces sp. NPDC006458 TaxID=3154302 RepID=UPI0033BB1473
MATVPSLDTWVAKETPTANKMNKNVRDASNFLLNTPFAWGYRNAVLSLTDGVWTDVTFDAEKADNDAMFSTSTGFTVVTPGWYSVRAGSRFGTSGTGYRALRLKQNGNDIDVVYGPGLASANVTLRAETEVYCNAGDTFTLAVMTSGVAVAVIVGQPFYTFLRARWMAA